MLQIWTTVYIVYQLRSNLNDTNLKFEREIIKQTQSHLDPQPASLNQGRRRRRGKAGQQLSAAMRGRPLCHDRPHIDDPLITPYISPAGRRDMRRARRPPPTPAQIRDIISGS